MARCVLFLLEDPSCSACAVRARQGSQGSDHTQHPKSWASQGLVQVLSAGLLCRFALQAHLDAVLCTSARGEPVCVCVCLKCPGQAGQLWPSLEPCVSPGLWSQLRAQELPWAAGSSRLQALGCQHAPGTLPQLAHVVDSCGF